MRRPSPRLGPRLVIGRSLPGAQYRPKAPPLATGNGTHVRSTSQKPLFRGSQRDPTNALEERAASTFAHDVDFFVRPRSAPRGYLGRLTKTLRQRRGIRACLIE